MKKVLLSAAAFAFLCRVNAYAQLKSSVLVNKPAFTVNAPIKADTAGGYQSRALKIDEINIVSSYYSQTGEHSAITGGIGTQNVTDISNGINLNLAWLGNTYNKNTLSIGMGFDHHTSASSAYTTLSGLGKQDGSRIYPSLDWSVENTKKGTTFGAGAYYSGEYNYKSLGGNFNFALKTKDRSGEFSAKFQAYLDHVTLIFPAEQIAALTPPPPAGSTYVTTASGNRVLSSSGSATPSSNKPDLATSPRNTFTASFAWSQIINSRLQVALLADVVQQKGLLSLPYHRVYLSNGLDTIERLPASRFKIPIGARLNYFAGDRMIIRTYYRYYSDNWDTRSHTANIELAYKFSPFFSLSPFYRYYTQTASKYFAPYKTAAVKAQYFSSNYEYAAFDSNFFGAGIRLSPPKGVAGWQRLREIEFRYGHYSQSVNLVSDVFSMSLGFK